jgi:hypothetical protein
MFFTKKKERGCDIMHELTDFSVTENRVTFTCHLKRGGLDAQEEETFELVQFVGYFRKFGESYCIRNDCRFKTSCLPCEVWFTHANHYLHRVTFFMLLLIL